VRYNMVNYKELPVKLLNKALEPHGVTVKQLEEEKKKASDYAFTSEEDYEAWKQWCIEKIMKVMRVEKRQASMEFDIFDLTMGPGHDFGLFKVRKNRTTKKGS
jgi:hypothetical protein